MAMLKDFSEFKKISAEEMDVLRMENARLKRKV